MKNGELTGSAMSLSRSVNRHRKRERAAAGCDGRIVNRGEGRLSIEKELLRYKKTEDNATEINSQAEIPVSFWHRRQIMFRYFLLKKQWKTCIPGKSVPCYDYFCQYSYPISRLTFHHAPTDKMHFALKFAVFRRCIGPAEYAILRP